MVINRKNIKFKITHIFMDGTRIGSEYTNDMPLRRKKIQVIGSTNKVESFKKNQYYQTNNPYSLNRNYNTPYQQRTQVTPDNYSNRDTLTQTSSQKSAKIIRTNGLTKAQKPNLSNSKVSRGIIHRSNGIKVGPAFSTGSQEQPKMNINYITQQHYINSNSNVINRNENPKNKQAHNTNHNYNYNQNLQQQNQLLRQQNNRLKQQMIRTERTHFQEVKVLKQQLDRVFRMVGDLENRIGEQDKQWEKFCREKEIGKEKQKERER